MPGRESASRVAGAVVGIVVAACALMVAAVFVVPVLWSPPGAPLETCGADYFVVEGRRVTASGLLVSDEVAFRRECERLKDAGVGVTLLLNDGGDYLDPETGQVLANRSNAPPHERYDAFELQIEGDLWKVYPLANYRPMPAAQFSQWVESLLAAEVVRWDDA